MNTLTDRSRAALLSRIDRLEQEMVSEWGTQGQQQVAQQHEQCAREREQLLPKPAWWQVWRPAWR